MAFLLRIDALSSQETLIETQTDSDLSEIVVHEDLIFVNGIDGYLGKYSNDCSELQLLNSPHQFGYNQTDLYVLDSNRMYLASHKGFPHHALIYESMNQGLSLIHI